MKQSEVEDFWDRAGEAIEDPSRRSPHRVVPSNRAEIFVGIILLIWPLFSLGALIWIDSFAILTGVLWGILNTLWIFGVLLLRNHLLRRQIGRGELSCPRCDGERLVRLHRRWYDRLPALLGVKTRRYRCKDCDWSSAIVRE